MQAQFRERLGGPIRWLGRRLGGMAPQVRWVLLAGVLLAWTLGGCSSDKKAVVIVVAVSPSAAQTIDQGQSVNITGTVSNDTANKGVMLSVSGTGCSGNACGTLSATTAASGAAVTYKASAGGGGEPGGRGGGE